MPIEARRALRLGIAAPLSLVLAYSLGLPLPYLAPLLAVFLGAAPTPLPGPGAVIKLLLVLAITLGSGLWIGVALEHYPLSALLLVALGLFAANLLALQKGQAMIGTLLTAGLTLISAAASVSSALASAVVVALLTGVVLAVVSLWLGQLLVPVPGGSAPEPAPSSSSARWLSLRATIILLPAYLVVLTNPAMYMPLLMKSAQLGQMDSISSLRVAGRELVGSTLMAGLLAVLFWGVLRLAPTLWFFALWFAVLTLAVGGRMMGAVVSRYSATFWQNAMVTVIILLGPAVQDSANGKDVYQAFAIRFSLFLIVAIYTWFAVNFLEQLRARRMALREVALR
jgi:hypothetical protein